MAADYLDPNFIKQVGQATAVALAATAPAEYPTGDIYDRSLIEKLGLTFAKAIADSGDTGGGGNPIIPYLGAVKLHDALPTASSAPTINISINNVSTGVFTFVVNGDTRIFTLDYTDPNNGSHFIDLNFFGGDATTLAAQIAYVWMSQSIGSSSASSNVVTLTGPTPGALVSMHIEITGDMASNVAGTFPVTVYGTDLVSPTAIKEVTLMTGIAGKKAYIISAKVDGNLAAVTTYLSYLLDGTYTDLCSVNSNQNAAIVPSGALDRNVWITPPEGASLVYRYLDNPDDLAIGQSGVVSFIGIIQ